MCICDLMRIQYHIFTMYMISRVCTDFLTLPQGLIKYSDIPYDVTPYGSNAVYLNLYILLWPCMTEYHILFHSTILLQFLVRMFVLFLLRVCLIPNTILWSLYDSWFQAPNIIILFFLISIYLISLLYFLIGTTPMIRYLNLLKRLPCVCLVMKYLII